MDSTSASSLSGPSSSEDSDSDLDDYPVVHTASRAMNTSLKLPLNLALVKGITDDRNDRTDLAANSQDAAPTLNAERSRTFSRPLVPKLALPVRTCVDANTPERDEQSLKSKLQIKVLSEGFVCDIDSFSDVRQRRDHILGICGHKLNLNPAKLKLYEVHDLSTVRDASGMRCVGVEIVGSEMTLQEVERTMAELRELKAQSEADKEMIDVLQGDLKMKGEDLLASRAELQVKDAEISQVRRHLQLVEDQNQTLSALVDHHREQGEQLKQTLLHLHKEFNEIKSELMNNRSLEPKGKVLPDPVQTPQSPFTSVQSRGTSECQAPVNAQMMDLLTSLRDSQALGRALEYLKMVKDKDSTL